MNKGLRESLEETSNTIKHVFNDFQCSYYKSQKIQGLKKKKIQGFYLHNVSEKVCQPFQHWILSLYAKK